MRYDLTDNMTEEMIGRNHHKEKKINFHSIGVLFYIPILLHLDLTYYMLYDCI
jgi:hypothetical protein